MLTLITTARLNDVDPKAWLADVFGRIAEIPQARLHELLPWEWKAKAENGATAQAAETAVIIIPDNDYPRAREYRGARRVLTLI